MSDFNERVAALRKAHEELLTKTNKPLGRSNGIYEKYENPILTAEHTPLEWRYDFDEKDNPYLMQRIMMNATLNSGAIKWNGDMYLWCAWREPTARASSPWQKAPTEWTTSASGQSLSPCQRTPYQPQTSTTCA